jgi:hypothetical protein
MATGAIGQSGVCITTTVTPYRSANVAVGLITKPTLRTTVTTITTTTTTQYSDDDLEYAIGEERRIIRIYGRRYSTILPFYASNLR